MARRLIKPDKSQYREVYTLPLSMLFFLFLIGALFFGFVSTALELSEDISNLRAGSPFIEFDKGGPYSFLALGCLGLLPLAISSAPILLARWREHRQAQIEERNVYWRTPEKSRRGKIIEKFCFIWIFGFALATPVTFFAFEWAFTVNGYGRCFRTNSVFLSSDGRLLRLTRYYTLAAKDCPTIWDPQHPDRPSAAKPEVWRWSPPPDIYRKDGGTLATD